MSAPADADWLSWTTFDDPDSLIYGIGNVGRQDDGLGWAFIDRVERGCRAPRAHTRRGYQLLFEDADVISRYQRVLFVDATKDPQVESFRLTRPTAEMDLSFTSHAFSVAALLATTRLCFTSIPDCALLVIRGYEWELAHGLTPRARGNLDLAWGCTARNR